MASNINRVTLSGNLTRDPELRSTQSGTHILTFGVAVNDRRKNPQTGEWEDVPNYVDCAIFGSRAQPLSQMLTKGSKVALEGKLRWSQWERDGQKHSKLEVIVDELELMSQRQQQGGYQQAPQMAPRANQRPQFQPQNQNGYQSAPQQQMAPQMPLQQGYVAAPGVYQSAIQQPQVQQMPAQQDEFYDEPIPF